MCLFIFRVASGRRGGGGGRKARCGYLEVNPRLVVLEIYMRIKRPNSTGRYGTEQTEGSQII